jgi:hypothetical protein
MKKAMELSVFIGFHGGMKGILREGGPSDATM